MQGTRGKAMMFRRARARQPGPTFLGRGAVSVGANLHFPKYFEKYARLAREEKFPEIYRTRDRILLFVSALYGFRVLH